MKIYLDDSLADKSLLGLLRKNGHTVARPFDYGLVGASDARHLERTIREDLTTLTADRDDFGELHQLILTSGGGHPGIFVVRFENDPKKDMKPKHIAAAIAKLEKSGISVKNDLVVLNHWR